MTQTVDTDPFAELEERARRETAEEAAAKAVSETRATLVIGRDAKAAFFATLAMGLKPEVNWEIDTCATDGKTLAYNPAWFAALPQEQRLGIMAHEVMHCALKHPFRRGQRDPDNWNIACDGAINNLIKDAGYKLPPGGVIAGEGEYKHWPAGLCAEDYYALIPSKPPKGDQGDKGGDGLGKPDGQPGGDPGGCGGVYDPTDASGAASPAAQREAEADWEVKTLQAAEAAKRRGALPGFVQRLVGDIQNPKVDWREQLRQFISTFARNDYSWSPPNRRFIHLGMYLPGLRSEEIGTIVLAVDTSGSIGKETLDRFASEAQGILDSYDCELKIIYHDSKVAGTDSWKSSDGPLVLKPVGGGGTDHVPVFEHIEREQLEPVCLVCLTDCFTQYPPAAPSYPTLWCVVGNDNPKVPFGQVVQVGG